MIFALSVSTIAALLTTTTTISVCAATPLEKAILDDILTSYDLHEPSTCVSSSSDSTSASFDWPGTNVESEWYDSFEGFEQDLFLAIMSHNDTVGSRSWSIRIGTGGNMYSHYARDLHGESLPPQAHPSAPFVDEVQQMVAVNLGLNRNADYDSKFYFHHQAGAYQRDAPYTDVPFFSPSLAKHCEGNSCAFASWGTQAHVATPFTSPVLYITKYTDCGGGVIEMTQMMHNFAPATAPAAIVDQNYFNVGWGGVRTSTLPIAIEPKTSDDSLSYTDPNDVDYLEQCSWGVSHNNPEQIVNLDKSGGYTSFATSGLLVNRTIQVPEMPCRDNADPMCSNVATCMVKSCTDAQVAAGTHTRMELRVRANAHPACAQHSSYTFSHGGNVYPGMKCNFRDTQFGRTTPNLSSPDDCAPWAGMGLKNTLTGGVLEVAHIKHWSWRSQDEDVFLAIYETDVTKAINTVNAFFDNTGNSNQLPIEIVVTTNVENVPIGYNPSSTESAFTFVYGKGRDYKAFGGSVDGFSRRRLGSTARDYTVFTVNWLGGSNLGAGDTYINRSFVFASELGAVDAVGKDLTDKVYVDQMVENEYNPRRIDIYQLNDSFSVEVAATSEGQSTTCSSSLATLVCSGTSAPSPGKVPFFYVTCGLQTYLGSDPYHFTPDFGATFPNHGSPSTPVRSYVCDGQDASIRPSWKLIGFFDPNDARCTDLATSLYDESVCPAANSSTSPSGSPSKGPSPEPSASPSSAPSYSPSKVPSSSPITVSPSTSPTSEPSKNPTESPSKGPSQSPSDLITSEPSASPSSSPSYSPSKGPSSSPTTKNPSKSPTFEPSKNPTESPSSSPSKNPTNSPTTLLTFNPSQSPSDLITSEPSAIPSSSPTNSSASPSGLPSMGPSQSPSYPITSDPSASPSSVPSDSPSSSPTFITSLTDFPTSLQPTYLPTEVVEATTLRTLVCGFKDKCSANQKTAEKTTVQAVRCCRDESHGGSGGWRFKCLSDSQATYSSSSGPWGQSKMDIIPGNLAGSSDNRCVETDFDGAVKTCEANNARLCTPQEMSDGCTRGTGCSFNSRLAWTCIAGGDGCSDNAECCSGTCGSDGTCTAVPTLSPSNEPTFEPSQNPTTYSPTTSPSGSPSMGPSQRPLEATTLRTLVCGAKDNCSANQKTAEKTTMQAVRCCRDELHGGSGGWQFKCLSDSQATYSSSSGPWGHSKMGMIPDNLVGSLTNNQCVETDFDGAVKTCEANNARLCTPQEMSDGCTRGTGCNFNSRLAWTCITGGDGCSDDAECCSGTCGSDGTCMAVHQPTVSRNGCCSWEGKDCSSWNPENNPNCQYKQSDCENNCGGSWQFRLFH